MNGVEGQPSRPTSSSNRPTKNVLARAARQARALLQGSGRDDELEPEPARRTTILLLCATLLVTLFAPPVASGIAAVALATIYVGHTQDLHWLVKLAIATAGIGVVVALATYGPTTLQLLLTILWIATAAGIVLHTVRHNRDLGADPDSNFIDRHVEKRLRKALGEDTEIMLATWPGEEQPRKVIKRTHPAALALRMWGIFCSILIAILVWPIAAAIWLAAVHGATVAVRNWITWRAREKKISRRKIGKWVFIAELTAAGTIFVVTELSGIASGSDGLKAAMLAYIAILAILALNEWVDDYTLVATDGRVLRNTGVLWMQESIPTPLKYAEPGETKEYLPRIGKAFPSLGKLTIDVKLVDADEMFHDIYPLSDPNRWRLLLMKISDELDAKDKAS